MNKSKCLRSLESYGITEKDFDKTKKELSKQFGKEASDSDTAWKIFNILLMQNFRDFHKLKMLYYSMALFLNEEGKDHFAMSQQSRKMSIMKYRQDGDIIKGVEILAKNSCDECKKLNGKKFTFKEALEKMPIPCKDCTHKIYDKTRGFCRCGYVAVV